MVTSATLQLRSAPAVQRDLSARGRILIPLDGTPASLRAVPVACALAHNRDGAIDPVLITGSDIPTQIARLAEQRASSMIVIATHARGELGRLVHGSVAERVVELARVPVVLVPPGARLTANIRTLLVPVDDSPGSKRALEAATRLAREYSARIELLTVLHDIPAYVREPLPGIDLAGVFGPTRQAARQVAEEQLHTLAMRFSRAGLPVGYRVAFGPVVGAITRVCEELDADLIVMSTHGLTDPARTILGSISASVVRNTHRPVLLVHREQPRASKGVFA